MERVSPQLRTFSETSPSDQRAVLEILDQGLREMILTTDQIPSEILASNVVTSLKQHLMQGQDALAAIQGFRGSRISLRGFLNLPVIKFITYVPGVSHFDRFLERNWERWKEERETQVQVFAESLPELRESMVEANREVEQRALACEQLANALGTKVQVLNILDSSLKDALKTKDIVPATADLGRSILRSLSATETNLQTQRTDLLLFAEESKALNKQVEGIIGWIDSTLRVVLPGITLRRANETTSDTFDQLAQLAIDYQRQHTLQIEMAIKHMKELQKKRDELAKRNSEFPKTFAKALEAIRAIQAAQAKPVALVGPAQRDQLADLIARMQDASTDANSKSITGAPVIRSENEPQE